MLIGVDRPGYGLSTFVERLRLKDFAIDVNALADHLDLSRFSVLSWSGGGPFALTYIALNPDRVTSAVAVGSPRRWDASQAGWMARPWCRIPRCPSGASGTRKS